MFTSSPPLKVENVLQHSDQSSAPCGGSCQCPSSLTPIQNDSVTIDDLLCKDGPLLRVLQFSDLEQDSKFLIDRPLKASPQTVLQQFYNLPNHSPSVLKHFVNSFFEEPGSDLELWIPPDLPKEELPFLKSSNLSPIESTTAHEAIVILGCLGRKVKKDEECKIAHRTLLDIAHGFIIPGGRFREMYYWDTYWIMRGLLISCMYDTARGILQNYCDVISHHGFIPNGFRRYYLDRSQPPVFSLMLSDYFEATGDVKFIEKSYTYLQQEYEYFMNTDNNHVIYVEFEEDGNTVESIYEGTLGTFTEANKRSHIYALNRYTSKRCEPRPESYKEDYAIQKAFIQDDPYYANYLMRCLRAGGESGWDFSSRWYKVSERSRWSLESIDTLNILPVDLNTLLYLLENRLSEWALLQSNLPEETRQKLFLTYKTAAHRRSHAMRALMWDNKIYRWCDYLCKERCLSAIPNLASVWPLWAGLTPDDNELENAINFLVQHSGLWREWGLAPTAINSGQQWDLPNGWPPLAQICLQFLLTCKLPQARIYGLQMLERCLTSAIEGKLNSGCFYEKYSTEICGSRGSGGEYVTQVGFGWTNAVILEWIKYKAFNFDLNSIIHVLQADYNSELDNHVQTPHLHILTLIDESKQANADNGDSQPNLNEEKFTQIQDISNQISQLKITEEESQHVAHNLQFKEELQDTQCETTSHDIQTQYIEEQTTPPHTS